MKAAVLRDRVRGALDAVRGQVGEEPREVPGDRGIGGIGQAQLLQADPARPLGPRIRADHREEALDQRVDQLVARELGGDRAADQPRAPAQYGDGLGLDASPLEEPLLADPALVPELLELPRVDAVAGALELLLQPSRERQIHVVAAQQDVLAHGDAAQRERTVLLADRDEAEVGGPASHVAHQDQVAHLHALAPGVALRGEPRVERRLGLFEEAHARQASLRRRPERQRPRLLVERGGHGHEHLLVGERRVVAPVRVLPGASQVRQVP